MAKKVLQQEREEWRRREYRRLILQAAERVIVKKGLSATTMDDVAREAEFSKATLYQYFQGKTSLLLEILANFFDEIALGIQEISQGPGSAREKMRASIRFYLEYFQKKENVARMLWMDREFRDRMTMFVSDERRLTTAADLKYLEELKLKRKAGLEGAARIIEQGVAAKEFREIDVPSAVTIIESLLDGFCHLHSWSERTISIGEAVDAIYDFVLKGLENSGSKAKGES